jgi:hypothetical protein
VPATASREDKESMRTAVQVAFVKVKDVLRRIAVKSFSVIETLRLLMGFPTIVCFRSRRIPVIENFKIGVILSYFLTEFRYSLVSKRAY